MLTVSPTVFPPKSSVKYYDTPLTTWGVVTVERSVFGLSVTSNGSSYATGPLSCLSYLPVTLVYCGLTVGWIKTSLGTEVGLGPGDIALDGVPAPSHGNSTQLNSTLL